MQKQGYIFPKTEIKQTQASPNAFNIQVSVDAGQKRSVVFRGYRVTKHQKQKYDAVWREGFSEEGVLELIREDLLRGLWFDGYHKATVRRDTTSTNGMAEHVFTMTPGPLYKNVQYVFHGANAYRPEDLQEDLRRFYPDTKEMNTEAIHNFNSFKDRITALYVQKGYLGTEVTSENTNYGTANVEKVITLDEGRQSRIREVLLSDGLRFPPELESKLHLTEGSVYLPQLANEDALNISEYYERKGYRKFQMQTETTKLADGDIVLKYKINPGGIAHVSTVEITGDHYTDRDLIEKRVGLKPGDVLNHEKLASAQKSLTDLRIFHQVNVEAEETNVSDEYNVVVNVSEIKRYELTYGLRYDTEKSIGGEAQLSNISLFGKGQSLSLYTRINRENQLYQTTYHSPTRAGLKWKTLISTSYESGKLFLRETNDIGLAEGQRLNFTFQRQHLLWNPFILVYNYEFERLRTREFDRPDLAFDKFKISRLGTQIFADTRDDPINTKLGSFVSFDFQWAPSFLISDVSYVRSYSQYLNFQPMGRFLWASAVRLGLSSHLDRRLITERFLAGGSYTIRGFGKDEVGPKDPFGNPLGGEAVFVLNEEMRVPIYKWISGVAFYDAGNVYNNFGDFNPFRLRHSVGAGLRFDSPFGIVRGDIGVNLFRRDDEPRYVFHFGIGQAF